MVNLTFNVMVEEYLTDFTGGPRDPWDPGPHLEDGLFMFFVSVICDALTSQVIY